MALYTEACTVVITDAGLSESLEVKVGLNQASVLSPLLFASVMDVVSSEVRFTVYFGKPAMRTRWRAGAAPHKSG